jgi:hypothetical protein
MTESKRALHTTVTEQPALGSVASVLQKFVDTISTQQSGLIHKVSRCASENHAVIDAR